MFLDIDGVVCLHEEGVVNWGEGTGDDVFDEGCCRRLKEIVDATDCKLVLSSFWRLYKKDVLKMLEQLEPFGITIADFHGKTRLLQSRDEEIKDYLARHPEIDCYVAVDDEDFSGELFPADRFVLTDLARGITEEVKTAIIDKLQKP